MRLIHNFENPDEATAFSRFLASHNIESQVEYLPSPQTNEVGGQVWVIDEDHAQRALSLFTEFQADPKKAETFSKEKNSKEFVPSMDSHFQEKTIYNRPKIKRRRLFGEVTAITILLCTILFFWGLSDVKPLKNFPKSLRFPLLIASPVYENLMFDYPMSFALLKEFYDQFVAAGDDPNYLKTPQAQALLRKYYRTPYWQGIYDTYLLPHKDISKDMLKGPLFEKIRQGEVWRLFTPALLHANLLHLFFNMIWFAILGNQIEQRIGWLRYIIFIVVTAIIANLSQYLMTGPNFLGISGVVAAMAGFIWVRQTKAVWEGYTIQKATLLFLAFYILIMLLLQIASYVIQLSGGKPIAPNIANTAHIVGAISGMILGGFKFFSAWKMGHIKK